MSLHSSTQLQVSLGDRSYPILIGPDLLGSDQLTSLLGTMSQILIVTNDTIAPLYLEAVSAALSAEVATVESIVLPDGEQFKTLATVSKIYDQLMALRFDRKSALVALGGGVVGDMTGFAAATYQRGIRFIQIPTTLLAQVDSSVGGKTGVNHTAGKNMIGAFHQPESVIIDTATLATLPDREFRAGLAEVIKYGLIADRDFLYWLADNIERIQQREGAAVVEAIRRSCENKAQVVAKDERESGIRAILNLGHTFGHAIETATSYKHWLHGEAVGFGMIVALELSKNLGKLTAADVEFAVNIIRSVGLPTEAPPGLNAADIKQLMGADKKVEAGTLRLVLLRSLGDAYVTADFDDRELDKVLSQFFSE